MRLLRQALRSLVPRNRRGRAVTLLAIFSLALGIAGNAVVFSLVDSLLFLRLPYAEPERVVLIGQREITQPDVALLSLLSALPVWADFRDRSSTMTDWAAINLTFMSLAGGDRSEPIMAASVTPSLFDVLGDDVVIGRVFTEAEGVVGGPKLAVLNYEYWQRTGGTSRDVLGTVLTLDSEPYVVIGVLPQGYDFLTPDVDVWVPLQQDPYAWSREQRYTISLARMVPGVTMDQVRLEMDQITEDLRREFPAEYRTWAMSATNLRTDFPDPQSRKYLAILQGCVFFVLLIACANVTNLLLARSQDRASEIAVRTALGAGRLRIVMQLMRESAILAGVGGALGLALTAAAIRIVSDRFAALQWVPSIFEPVLDAKVLMFTVSITLFCGLVFGLFPSLQAFKVDQVAALKQGGGRGSGLGQRGTSIAAGLVVAQIALSFVALGGGFVLARSFLDMINGDPGFEAERLLAVAVQIPAWKYDGLERSDIIERVRAAAAQLPGAEGATVIAPLPKNLVVTSDTFRIGGRAVEVGAPVPSAVAVWVSPQYPSTFGVTVRDGRFIAATDREDSDFVVAVNASLAERHFPQASPVSERLTFRGQSREIVGVVADVQHGLVPRGAGGSDEAIYIPVPQAPRESYYVVLRTAGDPRSLADPVRAGIWAIDPDLTINTVETMQEYGSRYTTTFDLFNGILSAFGILALLLASLGTYGVMAYSVAQRRHEIGVRLAMGARAQTVVGMIALEGVRMSCLGLLIGAAVLVPVVAVMRGLLIGFGLEPMRPDAIGVVALILFAVSVLASVVPATRAASVDPVSVLRAE